MYAQNSILCQFGNLEICPNFANPYLTQFSSISGGNCITVEGPTYIYGDNQSVLANTTIPDSTLKKKSQSIAYHLVHEGVARDEWKTSYVNTHDNKADLLTKQLPHGEKRKRFCL